MKSMKFLILLSLILISACTAARKDISSEQEYLIPGWKLGYEHLGILSIALDQKNEPHEYALHSISDPILKANIITRNWKFSYGKSEYEITESDYYVRAKHEMGEAFSYKVLNYVIYSEDGGFVMELEKLASSEGETQFLVRPLDNGITVDIFDSGEPTGKTIEYVWDAKSESLPIPYGCSNHRLRSLKDGDEFSYSTFGLDSHNLTRLKNKVIKENDIMKLISKEENGPKTEMSLNEDLEVIRMESEGLEFIKCDVDTALLERQE